MKNRVQPGIPESGKAFSGRGHRSASLRSAALQQDRPLYRGKKPAAEMPQSMQVSESIQ